MIWKDATGKVVDYSETHGVWFLDAWWSWSPTSFPWAATLSYKSSEDILFTTSNCTGNGYFPAIFPRYTFRVSDRTEVLIVRDDAPVVARLIASKQGPGGCTAISPTTVYSVTYIAAEVQTVGNALGLPSLPFTPPIHPEFVP